MRADQKKVIENAKQGFEKALFAEDYDHIHLDEQHLVNLLKLCQIMDGKRYLDLGTGNGYIAFEMAQQNPHIFVTGLDIVDKAMVANNRKAKAEQHHHLDFMSYQGTVLPFEDSEFFGVISRYAFHHFPNPALSTAEIARIVEIGGFCLIADPVPDSRDEANFINRFMALKEDGHVHLHSNTELEALFTQVGFNVEKQFSSSLTFPRQMNSEYKRLIAQTPPEILQAYQLQLDGDEVYVTVAVLNTRFRRYV